MFFLTHRERKVLIAIAVLILTGTLLRFLKASAVDTMPAPAIVQENSSKTININSASIQELQKIKGVGRVTAKRISDYRDKFGKFKTAQDLKKVKGIGESKAKVISKQVQFKLSD